MAGHSAVPATDDYDVGDDRQHAALRLLAHSLVGFAAQQDLRLDTFALGPASRALGRSADSALSFFVSVILDDKDQL